MAKKVVDYVKEYINSSPYLIEMLIEDLISGSNLARHMKVDIEKKMGEGISEGAINMAIRRYSEELKREISSNTKNKNLKYELTMKSGIYDVNIVMSRSFTKNIDSLYSIIHPENGDFLNISLGEHETAILISEKYSVILNDLIKREEVISKKENMVALTILFDDNLFLLTPGITYLATRKLAWNDINIYEIVSTLKVLTFVIEKKDSLSAYSLLEEFLSKEI